MTCLNCKIELKCPCINCVKSREKRGIEPPLVWIWVDGENIKCPECGYSAHADIWQDFEMEQYNGAKNFKYKG